MPSTPKTTNNTQTQTTQLPAWVSAAGQSNYDAATDLSKTPYQGYQGALTAGQNAQNTTDPTNLINGSTAAAQAGYGASNGALAGAGGVSSGIAGQGLDMSKLGTFMNPYEDDVVKSAQAAGAQSLAASQQKNSDAAIAAGAFGSSRHGVTEGVTAAQGAQDIAGTVAGIRSAGFNTALGALQTSTQDQLAGNAQTLQGASQYAANGAGLAGALSNSASMTNSLGNQTQATQQAADTAALGQFKEQQAYPADQLNMRMAALGLTPYNKTTTGSGTSTTAGGDNPWLTAAGIGTSLFSFSDPKLKKNVKKLGDGPNGIPVKQFEYTDDAQKKLGVPAGRHTGFMADDVKKRVPSAVKDVPIGNGKTAMAVNYSRAAAPRKGLFGFGKKAA